MKYLSRPRKGNGTLPQKDFEGKVKVAYFESRRPFMNQYRFLTLLYAHPSLHSNNHCILCCDPMPLYIWFYLNYWYCSHEGQVYTALVWMKFFIEPQDFLGEFPLSLNLQNSSFIQMSLWRSKKRKKINSFKYYEC